ncbi:MAG TPA: metallophosphoesterase [Burkholderiales bacterium]|nr:metallophosphoesterase [Burkholderiales bacterium]
MRIQLLSDLHLEHSHRHPPFALPATDADLVVLAGDIDNGTRAIDWAEATFPGRPVLYVPGNHEYYDTEMGAATAALKARAAHSANVRLLDDEEWIFGGVRFLGSTLWTDFELLGRDAMEEIMALSLGYVVDFRKIRVGGSFLTPMQTVELHRRAIAFLEARLSQPFAGQTVVVTHHAPHPGSIHARWTGNRVNPAFVSDLTRLMGRAELWLHGHTHDGFDYVASGTRVIANPMGYRTSNWREPRAPRDGLRVVTENALFDPSLVIEI